MLPFLLTPFGRIAGTIAIAAVAWFGFAVHYEKKGALRVTEKIEKRITQHAKTADAQRDAVKSLSPSGLLDAYTRD